MQVIFLILTYMINKSSTYFTVREVISNEFKISSRLLAKLRKSNKIFIDGIPTYIDKSISVGNIVSVNLDFEEDNSNIVPIQMQLDIIYEDDCFIVVNKPHGIAVHPSCMHYDTSLSSGIKFYYDSINLKRKIRPVNRLDKDTSGIVIFAKNEYIQECLIQQMKVKSFKKEYIAILEGTLEHNKRYY